MSQTFPEQQTHTRPQNDWMAALRSWMGQSQQIVSQWIYDAGDWIFTGLIAVALLILMSLVAIGHTDRVLLVAALTLAAALPLNLAGLWIEHYLKNRDQALALGAPLQSVIQQSIEDEATVRLPPSSTQAFSARQRSFTNTILSSLLGLSVLLTLIGIIFTFWHISWAVTLVFLIALIVGVLATLWVLAYRG